MAEPHHVIHDQSNAITFFVIAFLRYCMCKDIFRTETPHEETFSDLTTPPSFSDLSLALLAEFKGELIAFL